MKDYLTTKETMDYLNISNGTLYNYINKGILHPRKIVRKLYFKKSELDELIDKAGYIPESRKWIFIRKHTLAWL